MSYILLFIGFVFLVKGADIFVDGSSALAKKFSIPSLIIGLTIVAFGTSAPELAVSLSASLKEANDMAVGNVIGSNLFNLLVVLGISGLFYPLRVQKTTLVKDFPFVLLATVILIVLCVDQWLQPGSDNLISRSDGIILLALLGIYMYSLIGGARASRKGLADDTEIPTMPLGKSVLFIIFGMTGIVLGGEFVVNSAKAIALQFGMSENLVGLTIVAIGTSLPELVTSVAAALKKETDIAIGNVIGSNIFNILLILGVSSAISPMAIHSDVFADLFFLLFVTVLVFAIVLARKNIEKLSGAILTAIYIIYVILIILRN